jgi:uncharacterized protein YndB with AHSA1/START domain
MPTVRRRRLIEASPEDLWRLVRDPHHLPRWWPRVSRVEAVDRERFTEVLLTSRGKPVRADFLLESADEDARRLVWSQELWGTPFARVLRESRTEIALAPAEGGTEVSLQMSQRLNGLIARLGALLVRRAAAATLEEALDGLQRIAG